MQSHIEALSELAKTGRPFVAVTMVEAKGSTPQDCGSKMLVDANGLAHGTVGGGKVEHQAIEFACELLSDAHRNRELVDWNLQRDVGMTCGGIVKLFFEVYNRDEWRVFLYGAGHVAQSLVRVLMTLTCRVTVIDSRSEWLDRMPEYPNLNKICVDNLSATVETITENDYVICMTMGHSTDRPILSAIFERNLIPAYLGVIGSRSKRGVLIRELKEEGINPEIAGSFLCPIGLPIGSNQPGEIAISIAAQLLERRDQLNQRSMEQVADT